MKVRMLKATTYGGKYLKADKEYEVSEKTAKQWERTGYAKIASVNDRPPASVAKAAEPVAK